MAPSKRKSDPSIRDRLFRECYGFAFFQAVRLLEILSPEKKPLGQTLEPNRETVRFSVNPGLAFPPSDISGISAGDDGGPVHMEVTFMGLIGPAGVLPHWYNELVLERMHEKDTSLKAFYDIFHHRLISLFYLAWKKNRCFLEDRPGAGDRFSGYLLYLLGLGAGRFHDRIQLPEESLLHYSGPLSHSVASVTAIESTAAYFSDTPAEVEQFIGQMLPLDVEDRTQLGAANSRLGENAVCGTHVWESQTKFGLNLGPMNCDHFVRFLPSGDKLSRMFALIRLMVGAEYEFDIRLSLKREEVPPCILGSASEPSPRLGWTTWIQSPGFLLPEHPRVTFRS